MGFMVSHPFRKSAKWMGTDSFRAVEHRPKNPLGTSGFPTHFAKARKGGARKLSGNPDSELEGLYKLDWLRLETLVVFGRAGEQE
jgi:hypothetical protein